MISLQNRQHSGQSSQLQSSTRAFLAPAAPTFHAPGIVGQVIVRTNGPANAEVTVTFLIWYRKLLLYLKK